MIKLIDSNAGYKLTQVLAVYKREYAKDIVGLNYYIENHEVLAGKGGKAEIGQGQPLTEQTLFSLGSFLRARDKNIKMRKGLLPDTLMYIDSEYQTYIWYVPEHTGTILFSKEEGMPESGKFNHPNLLFKATADNLWVMAFKDRKPRLNTKLFKAPYLNLYDEGNMCKGNIKLDYINATETHADFMKAWEHAFFHSEFSTGLGKDKDFNAQVAANRKFKPLQFQYKTLGKSKMDLEEMIP